MKIAVTLTIVFIVLKLCNVINWSWFWVLSPIPIDIILIVILYSIECWLDD